MINASANSAKANPQNDSNATAANPWTGESKNIEDKLKGLFHIMNEAWSTAQANAGLQESLTELEELFISWKTLPKIRWDMAPDEALKDPHQRLAFAVGDYLAAKSNSRTLEILNCLRSE